MAHRSMAAKSQHKHHCNVVCTMYTELYNWLQPVNSHWSLLMKLRNSIQQQVKWNRCTNHLKPLWLLHHLQLLKRVRYRLLSRWVALHTTYNTAQNSGYISRLQKSTIFTHQSSCTHCERRLHPRGLEVKCGITNLQRKRGSNGVWIIQRN